MMAAAMPANRKKKKKLASSMTIEPPKAGPRSSLVMSSAVQIAAIAGPSSAKNISALPRDLGRKPCGRKSQTIISEATTLIVSTGPMRFRSSSTSAPQRSADAALEYVDDGRRVDADANDHGNQARHRDLLVPLGRVGKVTPARV